MALKVWITRTDTLAQDSADAVKAAGFEPVAAPLLTLAAASTPAASPSPRSALAFTSRNGVAAFAQLTDRRDWQIYCVGPASAKTAGELGFLNIIATDSDVDALAKRLIEDRPEEVVHYSGVHIAGDLTGALTQAGVIARREIIYETRPVHALPGAALAALQEAAAKKCALAILIYSPKAARILEQLLRETVIKGMASAELYCVSISSNVQLGLSTVDQNWALAKHLIAHSPNEPAMIEALETIGANA